MEESSQTGLEVLEEAADGCLVAPVEHPSLLASGDEEAGIGEEGEMPGRGGGGDAHLLADEIGADAIAAEVAVELGREVSGRRFEVVEDRHSDGAGDGLDAPDVRARRFRRSCRSLALSHNCEIAE